MPRIYISHRPEDSSRNEVRVIRERLIVEFGADNILESTGNPKESSATLQQLVQSCDILLVVIGQYWLHMVDEAGNNLLKDPIDPIHVEIDAGLKTLMGIKVMVVDSTPLPSVSDLPEVLRGLMLKDVMHAPDTTHLNHQLDKLMLEWKTIPTGTMAEENGIDLNTLDMSQRPDIRPRTVFTQSSTGLVKIVPESELPSRKPPKPTPINPFYTTLIVMGGLVVIGLVLFFLFQTNSSSTTITSSETTQKAFSYIRGEQISSMTMTHLTSVQETTTHIGFIDDSDRLYYLMENEQGAMRAEFIDAQTPDRIESGSPPFDSMARQILSEYPSLLYFERNGDVVRVMSAHDEADNLAVVITSELEVVIADAGTKEYSHIQKIDTLSDREPVAYRTLLYNDRYNLILYLSTSDEIQMWQIATDGTLEFRNSVAFPSSRGHAKQIAMSASGKYIAVRWATHVSLYEVTYDLL